MSFKHVLILGILQGLTEFLPISSSGHLVVVQSFLGLEEVPVLFDLILHLGTVAATVLVYYKIIGSIIKDFFGYICSDIEKKRTIIQQKNLKLLFFIMISVAVTGGLGFIFLNTIKGFFYRPMAVSLFIILTGFLLLITRFFPGKPGEKMIGDAGLFFPVIIGISQALAMLPGISRSGSTISAALFLGAARDFSGMYSFLLSIPSILGASVVEGLHAFKTQSAPGMWVMIWGFGVSLGSGYAALRLLLRFLHRGRLYAFSFYCFIFGVSTFVLNLLNAV